MTEAISLGASIPALLAARGVDHVFGIPGVHNAEMYRGLPGSGIRHITPRHEQGAGFMADGYARASGKPGVCFVISGPGVTNILTAMGQAYADSIPMIVIASVVARDHMGSGRGHLHELPDQRAMAVGVSGMARTILRADDFETVLDEALAYLASSRPRPVYIEIPTDVLDAPLRPRPMHAPPLPRRLAPQPAVITDMLARLGAAKSPVVLVGGGARSARVQHLAERLDAPVFMTANGRGLLPQKHPLAVSLSASYDAPRRVISQADMVLALGTELGETDYDFFFTGAGLPRLQNLIRVDIDPAQCHRSAVPDMAVVADVAATVEALLDTLPTLQTQGSERAETARSGVEQMLSQELKDLAIVEKIRDTLPGTRVIGDSTQLSYSAHSALAANFAGQFWSASTGYGTLGYALPAAIGASLADNAPVVALIGDGGLQFTLGELASAKDANAQVILLVHDNSGYGEIKMYMTGKSIVPTGVDIYTPNLSAIAAACGWTIMPVDELSLAPALLDAAQRNGPVMLYLKA